MKIAKDIAETLYKLMSPYPVDAASSSDRVPCMALHVGSMEAVIAAKLALVKRTFEMILESTTEEPFTLETRLDMCANLSRDILALFKE